MVNVELTYIPYLLKITLTIKNSAKISPVTAHTAGTGSRYFYFWKIYVRLA